MNKITLLFPALIFTLTIAFFIGCSSSPLKPVQSKSTLNIEAAIVYKMDGVQPVARSRFYLLDKSAEEILRSANLKPQSDTLDKMWETARKRGLDPNSLLHLDLLKLALKTPKDFPEYFVKLNAEIEKHTIKSDLTDLQGKTQFNEIESNRYFIFGMAETRGGYVVWDLPIEIKDEKQAIILDQNNAVSAD